MASNSDCTRRQFLAKSTLATGVTAASAGRQFCAAAQPAGANDRLRMAFIGCGGMASHHLSKLLSLRQTENLEIVAVCDAYEKRAREFQDRIAKEGGKADLVSDYRSVLERADVDYVLIATPEHSHSYLTLDALDAGKHVYVEKPMTHTVRESQQVLARVRETGLKVQVGVQGMADDSYASACEAIRAGKLGTVVEAQIDYVRNYTAKGPWRGSVKGDEPLPDKLDWDTWVKPNAPRPWDPHHFLEWRCYRDYSGGIATDLFIHRLTRILKACNLGFPSLVSGMGGIYTWPDGRDLPDSFEVLAQYPAVEGITNGMTVHLLGTMANDDGNDHCIRGTEATLFFTGKGWEIKSDEKGQLLESHRKTGGEDVGPHHQNHHRAIRDNAPLNCPPELGLYAVAACSMANQSWFEGKTMAWDAKRERVVHA